MSIPKNWVETTLSEINVRESSGIEPARFPDETFELYSVPSFDSNEPEIVKGSEIGSSKQIVDEGDVLICKINPRINRVWIVGNKTKHKKIASSEWIVVNTGGKINSSYLRYEFSAPFFRQLLESEVSGVGGSLTRARPKLVEHYKFPLAPAPEQKRIVAKLDSLFGHLDQLKARLENIPVLLKQFRQAVLTQAVTGKLTEEWRKKNNIKGFNQFIESDVEPNDYPYQFEINGWTWSTISSVANLISGYAFKSNEFVNQGYQLIRMGNLYGDKLDLSRNPVYLPKTINNSLIQKYSIKEGDILLTLTGTKYKRDYGYAVKVNIDRKVLLLNQRILSLRPIINPEFFYIMLQSDIFREQFFSFETGGNNQGNVGTTSVASILIPVPSSKEQIEIARRVAQLFAKTDRIEASYNALHEKIDHLPQAILAKAFRGELALHKTDKLEEQLA